MNLLLGLVLIIALPIAGSLIGCAIGHLIWKFIERR
jgi:hypothetical protein